MRSSRSRAALLAAWRAAEAQAERRQLPQNGVEPLALVAERGVVGIVRGREMGVHRLDLQVAARGELRQRAIEVVGPESEPVHAGVDLQAVAGARATAAAASCSARAADGVEIVGVRLCVGIPSRSLTLSAPKIRIGEMTPLRAGRCLPRCRARQHRRAGFFQRPRHLSAPWPCAFALTTVMTFSDPRKITDGPEIGADGVKVDACDGRPNHDATMLTGVTPRRARGFRTGCSLMKASLAVPTGPLRCLPMMISAIPCAS